MDEATKTEESATEETVEEKPAVEKNETNEILKEIKDKLNPVFPPAEKTPTPAEIRAQIKEQTGFTDAQLDLIERDRQAALIRETAPLKEKLAWSDLKESVGRIEPDIEAEMKKELSQYPINLRGDSVLVEKVYYMTVGRMSHKKLSNEKKGGDMKDDGVVSRRVISRDQGSSQSLSNGGSSSKAKISDDEARMAKRFGMTEEDWVRHKDTQVISALKK